MAEASAVQKGKIIAVDDDHPQRLMLEYALKSMGYDVTVVETPALVLERIRQTAYDVLLTDMQMPWMDGIRLVEAAKKVDPSLSCILMTAHGTIETAVEAMKNGAEDYILKPIEHGVLEMVLDRIIRKRALLRENVKLRSENEALKRDLGIRYHLPSTIGRSARALELHEQIKTVMKTRDPLLLIGERGVGKGDIARMIHYNSPWNESSLLSFDCNLVPSDLHESQLFGEEEDFVEGVPLQGWAGLLEKANGGTLVIDNIHVLHPKCFPGLHRLILEGKTQRVRGKRFWQIQVRLIVTCTPESYVQHPEISRKDGFFGALAPHTIHVPPLRERKEDIGVLAVATTKRFSASIGKCIEKIDAALMQKLAEYDFPGNMQELESLIETAVVQCQGDMLKLEHFPQLGGRGLG